MVTFQTRIRFVILNSDSAFTETIYWKLGKLSYFLTGRMHRSIFCLLVLNTYSQENTQVRVDWVMERKLVNCMLNQTMAVAVFFRQPDSNSLVTSPSRQHKIDAAFIYYRDSSPAASNPKYELFSI